MLLRPGSSSRRHTTCIYSYRQPRQVAAASGGGHLSSAEVSSLPLNARDFSKLLLLAAGTMTDTNGAANFTQQFAVNGQRGATTVFATDGFDTTDPEMGGATFSNFNVDAIQEVQSSSGVMPAEIGHGAAGFTNVVRSRASTRCTEVCSSSCATRLSTRETISITGIRPGSTAFRLLRATNLDSPTAARLCCRASTTGADAHFILASIRDFARCWALRRSSQCRPRPSGRGLIPRPIPATR